ncbi:MAG: hypothetical protein J6B39_04730 [Lachnospiraceae bacterium]|nr:hypothetical protein [Lachnospiraceae bacterium]
MSNFIKSFLVSGEQEKRVIDYNELIKNKIGSNKFVSADEAGGASQGAFFAGLTADVVEVLEGEEAEDAALLQNVEVAKISAEQIINEARSEAKKLVDAAKAESENVWNRAFESAKQEGFETGMKEGNREIERLKIELQREKERQQEEYTDLLNSMESDLVSVILDVFAKVTGVLSEDKKDIILHLINRTLEGADNSKEFVIRVSGEDYRYVTEHKEDILANLLPGSTLDIIKDTALSKNQCFIETDGGIFDCGLETQMNNLIANIKALSCM